MEFTSGLIIGILTGFCLAMCGIWLTTEMEKEQKEQAIGKKNI